jgi:hypothetical protein
MLWKPEDIMIIIVIMAGVVVGMAAVNGQECIVKR